MKKENNSRYKIHQKNYAVKKNRRLTKRAPDAGESGAIPGIFPVGRLRRPCPSAGNANRWAASQNDFG